MYNVVSVTKNRVSKARSLHGAIAAVIIGLLLTMMTYIFMSCSANVDLIWNHTREIVFISGAGMVSYMVIRLSDLWFLKLEKDWGIDQDPLPAQDDSSTGEPPQKLG